MIGVTEQQVPDEIRAWFDGTRPLPEGVTVYADQPLGQGPQVLRFMALGALAVAAAVALSAASVSGFDRVLGLGAAALCALGALYLFRGASQRARREQDIAAGRHRLGVFLGPRHLVVRSPGWVAVLPWSQVLDARVAPRHGGQVRWTTGIVVHHLDRGQRCELLLSTQPRDPQALVTEIVRRAQASA